MRAALRRSAWLLPLLALPTQAQAHIVSSRLGDFYGGALHPVTSLGDVVLWLALGLLAGMQRGTVVRWLVLVFPAGLALGFAAGAEAGWSRDPALLIAVPMVALGLLTAAALPLPRALFLALAFLLGVLRGAANAAGLEPGTDALLFGTGLVATGYAAVTVVTALVRAFADGAGTWRPIALRAGASWIAAIGLMIGTYAVAVG